jgi:hypothetical protein
LLNFAERRRTLIDGTREEKVVLQKKEKSLIDFYASASSRSKKE